ncbi:WAT1-related protein At2g39510-like [Mangifera indica]|uniref:WAT1-related protein At2g39510-like n=1 Tax=Mangifera indica TaxID=29780 RepID=UPI001CFA3E4C|nr:WAT1-related protein At2g39510-like [Mangifera indica]
MAIIVKHALDNGLSPHVLVALRMVVAAILVSPFAIVMERPVLSQNFSYTGMKYTTATFNVSMSNALPAMTFIMAWIFRLEIVKLRKLHGQAKIVGTLLAVGGGIIMTFVKGTLLDLPWKNGINIIFKKSATDVEHTYLMKGAGLIVVGTYIKILPFSAQSRSFGMHFWLHRRHHTGLASRKRKHKNLVNLQPRC